MEGQLTDTINQKLSLLVNFILEKVPNADKDLINHQINKLIHNGLTTTTRSKVIKKSTNILNTIVEQKPIIMVKKSHFSNYVLTVDKDNHKFQDLKTYKFVMDIDSQTIIGIENLKGEIEPLNKNLVEICHKYKIRYEIPLNLNLSEEPDQDAVIANEIHVLGLNHADSESEEDNDDD